jgi:hypothetical protein
MTPIRVAILAEEPLGWGSGKHFFSHILNTYTWTKNNTTYTINVQYLYDKDILRGKLTREHFDVFLVPGGGVGDGEAIMKGFIFLGHVRKWKKNIANFIKEGGGYVGICGGAALLTDLVTGEHKHPRTFLERMYHKSSLNISCVSSYYKTLSVPLLYPFQKKHPEKIGASAYVFSFAPGKTQEGTHIHTGGIPLDFHLCHNHPLFTDIPQDTLRIRWWGGPALHVSPQPGRKVTILARYPPTDPSDNKSTRIYAWRYTGGLSGLVRGLIKALRYIKKCKDTLKKVLLYTYYLSGPWEPTNKIIHLDYSNKPCITAEIYPNENKGRILLCTLHPEYMIWRNGHIKNTSPTPQTCLAQGLYHWENITPLSKTFPNEVMQNWWMIRRFVAWAAHVPATHLPPIEMGKEKHIKKSRIMENVFWDGSLANQIKNI